MTIDEIIFAFDSPGIVSNVFIIALLFPPRAHGVPTAKTRTTLDYISPTNAIAPKGGLVTSRPWCAIRDFGCLLHE